MKRTVVYENKILQNAADIIRNGGVVAFPTETVYGLGASAFDEKAVARVFEVKKRPFFDPLILHVGNKSWLDDLVTGIPAAAQKLIDAFWPGPLTVVLPKKSAVPGIVTSGLPSAALRMPSNDAALQIIRLAGIPVAAPSANVFGAVSPTTAEHVRGTLGAAVDMVVDGGECTVGIESTVVSFMGGEPMLLRPGGTALEDIEAVIGQLAIPERNELVSQSPGRSEQHYATSTPLILIDGISDLINYSAGADTIHLSLENSATIRDINNIGKIGLITLSNNFDAAQLPPNITTVEYLSKSGDLREAACNLFAAMRRLDDSGVGMIAATPVPNTGLGLAINDRLYRASMKRS
ncbi:MAG: threonylcarbamoyl-AMP synthase [Chitinispirillales bacterium]|jgi:L-threonylcarbamoyladenylate synthase|nr:threonylcarbamoyl-AMP synthase [Chitinispirillales bacterium]